MKRLIIACIVLFVNTIVSAKTVTRDSINLGIGCDLNEGQKFAPYFNILNIENPLYPNYIDSLRSSDIRKVLSYSSGKYIIIDGPFIDINPGTSVNKIKNITYDLSEKSIAFAMSVHAKEIIFLSTFIPQIKTASYDSAWLNQSAKFWKKTCNDHPNIRISICNTFETNPDILLKLYDKVNCKNFGLGFDLGHALMYSEIGLDIWYHKIEKYVHTIYIHSNYKKGDAHLDLYKGLLLEDKGFQEIQKEIKLKNLILKQADKAEFKYDISIVSHF